MAKSKSNSIKKILFEYWLVPVLFSLAVTIYLLIWLKLDHALPGLESGKNLYESVLYGRVWLSFLDGKITFGTLLSNYFHNFPLIHSITFVYYLIFGVSADVAVASNSVWILVFSYSLYNSCRIIFDKRVALASLFIAFSLPIIIYQMHDYQNHLPIMAWIMLTFYCLKRYSEKNDDIQAMLLGLCLGLGLLLGRAFLIVALIIMIYMLVRIIFQKKKQWAKYFRGLTISCLIIIVIALPWYLANYRDIFSYHLSLDFIKNIDNYLVFWPFLVMCLLGILVKIKKLKLQVVLVFFAIVFMSINIYILFSSPKNQICNIQNVVEHVTYGASVGLIGNTQSDFNSSSIGYYMEKAGRIWIEDHNEINNADYWILRVDKSADSRQSLFDYYNKGKIVTNISCSDSSFVVILKNDK